MSAHRPRRQGDDVHGDPDVRQKGADIVYPDPGFPIYRSMIEFSWRAAGSRSDARSERLRLLGRGGAEADDVSDPPRHSQFARQPDRRRHSREEMDKFVAGLAQWPNAAILSDEIYGQLTYDGLAHRSLMAYPEIRDRLDLLDGWSKTYAMTGWRLGYSVWPRAWRDVARKLAVNSYSCVNSAAQFAGIAALKGPQTRLTPCARNSTGGAKRSRPASIVFRRPRRDAKRRVLRFPKHFPHRLEGQAPRFSPVAGRGRGDDRRTRFRNPWRGLLAALLRQLVGEHRTRARTDAGLSQPSRARGVGPVKRSFMFFSVTKVMMRLVVFAAAAIALCPFARAEAARPSQAACDAAKIGARRTCRVPEDQRRSSG